MTSNIHAEKILILDFGAQYTQLIARRVREIGVYCEIRPYDINAQGLDEFQPNGIILSGGPETVTSTETPRANPAVFELGVPVLGICYGMQTMAQQLGGKVLSSAQHEFGYAQAQIVQPSPLLDGICDHTNAEGAALLDVWMSHGDHVTEPPVGFSVLAVTESVPVAAIANIERRFYGVQFHPEVTHTLQGERILERFVKDICECVGLWTTDNILEDMVAHVRAQVDADQVILGLSGG
ncbi:MAG: glutamine-hydrolyzing GMP synthase, partial [Pseudomonadales bacterium]